MDCGGQRRLRALGRAGWRPGPPQAGTDVLTRCSGARALPGQAQKNPSLNPERSQEARRGVYFEFHGLKALSKICTWFKCEHYLPIMGLSRVPQM